MNRDPVGSRQASITPVQARHGLACLTLLILLCGESVGQTRDGAQSPAPPAAIHVTHVLGFESVRPNAGGDLKIQGDAVQFQRDGSPTAEVNISTIQAIFVDGEDRQVGGAVMTLGKAAVPFGGGRVVSLITHKKYDILTLEYLDNKGGFHGAIFQLGKGQGQGFKQDLIARGAHLVPGTTPLSTP